MTNGTIIRCSIFFQSFSTDICNSSHKLDDKNIVYGCSRVKLIFPLSANNSLIIHGRLVCSGAKSKTKAKMSFITMVSTARAINAV